MNRFLSWILNRRGWVAVRASDLSAFERDHEAALRTIDRMSRFGHERLERMA